VYREIYRVLKLNGHFSISDILVSAPLPAKIKNAAQLHVGCVSGALTKSDQIRILEVKIMTKHLLKGTQFQTSGN
jgi:hypothetical protein